MNLLLIGFRGAWPGHTRWDIEDTVPHAPTKLELGVHDGGPFDELARAFPYLQLRQIGLTFRQPAPLIGQGAWLQFQKSNIPAHAGHQVKPVRPTGRQDARFGSTNLSMSSTVNVKSLGIY